MGKIVDFFKKWGFVVALCVVAVPVIFALVCCVYTAVVNPFIGIVGVIGAVIALSALGYVIYKKIRDGKCASDN